MMTYVYKREDAVNYGDCYLDSNGNFYMNDGSGFVMITSTLSNVNSYNTTHSSYASKSCVDDLYERNHIKEYLLNNPDLMDEIIMEIRQDKIKKIRNEVR